MNSHSPPRTRSQVRVVGATILAIAGLAGCSSLSLPNPFKPATETTASITTGSPKVDAGKIPGSDSIPVVVDDHPITRYDISQRVHLMTISDVKGDEKSATQDLIDEILELEEAAKFGITVSPDQVEAAYASIAGNLKLSPADLTKGLTGEGIDPNTLKRRLLAQITWQQLVVKRAQETNKIKESDVTSALLARGDAATNSKEYTLQQIVFVVPSGSGASAYEQRAREAEGFRQRFQGCDNSLALAKQLSGVVVKDLGRHESSDLSGSDGQAIRTTKVGGTIRPQQTPQGIEVIAVCAIKDVQSTAAARADIQNQLFEKQSDGIAADYLKALRAQATIVYR